MSDYLPEEILIQILVKLPVKSLIRLSTVCKSWQSLIRTPSFIFAHLSTTENENQALLRRYDLNDQEEHYSLFQIGGNCKNRYLDIDSSQDLAFPFKSQIGFYRIVSSCDGLLCLFNDLWVDSLDPVIIWNPYIRNHVVLPQPPIDSEEPHNEFGVADDFLRHNVVLGFGVADYVYKVVRLVYSKKSNGISPPQVDVCSLSSGRWRRLSGIHFTLRIPLVVWCQVSLKGFLHWIAYDPMSDNVSILTFHIGDEVFDEMSLPDELAMGEYASTMSLSKIGESLVVIIYNGDIELNFLGLLPCDVWMMKEYGVKESWSRLYSINFGERYGRVLSFLGSDEALLVSQEDGLLTFNKKTRWVISYIKLRGDPSSFYFDNYKESLLLLGGYRGALDEESSRGAMEGLSLGAG